MERRRLLLGAVGAMACPLCSHLTARPAWAAGDKPHWSYEGDTGPAKWGGLDDSYGACGAGGEQSPIDLADAVRADVDPVSIRWTSV